MKESKNTFFYKTLFDIVLLALLVIPFNDFGLNVPVLLVMNRVLVDIRFLIVGFIYVITCVIKRMSKSHFENDILIDGLLIILAYKGFISIMIPLIVIISKNIMREVQININMDKVKKIYKKFESISNILLDVGISLTLFYNLPFEIWDLNLSMLILNVSCLFIMIKIIIYYVESSKILNGR